MVMKSSLKDLADTWYQLMENFLNGFLFLAGPEGLDKKTFKIETQ
jgi:hypothetical protein